MPGLLRRSRHLGQHAVESLETIGRGVLGGEGRGPSAERAGEEAAPSLTETDVAAGVLDLPDEQFLDAVIARIAGANARGHALWTVVLGAAASDPLVDTALQEILRRRAADYRLLVDELARRGYAESVADPDATAAVLSFLLSPEGYQQLVAQSGRTDEEYLTWARRAVLTTLRDQDATAG